MQRDGGPYPADAVLGHAVALQEAAGFVGAVHLELPAAVAELLVQAEVVEHRPDVQQFRVEAGGIGMSMVASSGSAALEGCPGR